MTRKVREFTVFLSSKTGVFACCPQTGAVCRLEVWPYTLNASSLDVQLVGINQRIQIGLFEEKNSALHNGEVKSLLSVTDGSILFLMSSFPQNWWYQYLQFAWNLVPYELVPVPKTLSVTPPPCSIEYEIKH